MSRLLLGCLVHLAYLWSLQRLHWAHLNWGKTALRPSRRTIIKCHSGTNNWCLQCYLSWWQWWRDEVAWFSVWSKTLVHYQTPETSCTRIFIAIVDWQYKGKKKSSCIDCVILHRYSISYLPILSLGNESTLWFLPYKNLFPSIKTLVEINKKQKCIYQKLHIDL